MKIYQDRVQKQPFKIFSWSRLFVNFELRAVLGQVKKLFWDESCRSGDHYLPRRVSNTTITSRAPKYYERLVVINPPEQERAREH
jgi:hypothetical protein